MSNIIEITSDQRVGFITLNRPEKRNALSHELVNALKAAFANWEKNDEIRAVILKANGKAFCAGADLAYLQQLQAFTFDQNLEDSQNLRGLFQQIYQYPKPVIAQVEGHAIAGGAGLASVCDFVFAVPDAKFGFTEVKIGFIPALVAVFLMTKIGEGKARELLLSGNLYDSEMVKSMGLITDVIDPGQIADFTLHYAQNLIHQNSGEAMHKTKQMLAGFRGMTINEALDEAAKQNALARASEDCKKGIDHFLNKQSINW